MDNFHEEMKAMAPQFMGQQLGNITIEAVRSFIKKQKRMKGFNFNVPVGASSFDLKLSGTARMLLGIAIFGKSTSSTAGASWASFVNISTLQFQINNEIVIDQVDPNFLTPQFNNNEYYYIPRPLSGTDILTLDFVNGGGLTEICNVVLYYL